MVSDWNQNGNRIVDSDWRDLLWNCLGDVLHWNDTHALKKYLSPTPLHISRAEKSGIKLGKNSPSCSNFKKNICSYYRINNSLQINQNKFPHSSITVQQIVEYMKQLWSNYYWGLVVLITHFIIWISRKVPLNTGSHQPKENAPYLPDPRICT
jgi:hypothetical protein